MNRIAPAAPAMKLESAPSAPGGAGMKIDAAPSAPGGAGWKEIGLRSWGRSQVANALVARPERMRELHAALRDRGPAGSRALLPRGAARSYGDVCLNADGSVILTERLNRILSFDDTSGLLVAEPGVTFADLLAVFLPRGFRVPASPGTSFVTIGGAVANDIHGKNQHVAGCFGDCVEWLDLLCADGSVQRLSPTQNTALFDATIGGIGLTGIITAVCIRMVPVPSPALLVRRRRVGGLDEFLEGFAQADSMPFSVGWIDVLASGAALGRGILETAEPAPRGAVAPPPPHAKRMPIDLPAWALNGASVRAFNALYWRRAQPEAREAVSNYVQFLYPLDAITDWNRLYGRRGFNQFQCVVPYEGGAAAVKRLLRTASAGGGASFLAVLKVMGRGGRGLLSFAQPGYSLALDFAAGANTTELFRALEHITRDAGGRIYLAKDAMMSRESFVAMYPNIDAFQQMRETVDPNHRFSSSMSRRLGLG
jgi:decaprenylphospho-beta-D-ribofuranose 2-oxidase